MNNVTLTGRITRDIEVRKTPNGASVVAFTLASNRRFKSEGQPDADFINCVAWNKIADLMEKYLKKGSKIGVVGRIQTRSYDDKDGKRVYVTEVVADQVEFLENKKDGTTTTTEPAEEEMPPMPENMEAPYAGDGLDIADDDLPF